MGKGLVPGNSWHQLYQQNSISLTFSQKQKFISVGRSLNLGAVFSSEKATLGELLETS